MVPENHIVRDMEQVLDLRFVRDLCERYYSKAAISGSNHYFQDDDPELFIRESI